MTYPTDAEGTTIVAIEVEPVRLASDGMMETCEPEEAQQWAVYARLGNGLARWVADFDDRIGACRLAGQLDAVLLLPAGE